MVERIPIFFVYEDVLHKVTIEKILTSIFNQKYYIESYYPGRGFGSIKNNINSFNRASAKATYLVLVDLDKEKCPSKIIRDWLTDSKNDNLLFRIAVKEVESWIVGDVKNFAKFLHLRESKLKTNVDTIKDPKKYIFNLVKESRIRQLSGICPEGNGRIGNDYNEKLVKFVNNAWNPRYAMKNSLSLKRTIDRLRVYSPDYSE